MFVVVPVTEMLEAAAGSAGRTCHLPLARASKHKWHKTVLKKKHWEVTFTFLLSIHPTEFMNRSQCDRVPSRDMRVTAIKNNCIIHSRKQFLVFSTTLLKRLFSSVSWPKKITRGHKIITHLPQETLNTLTPRQRNFFSFPDWLWNQIPKLGQWQQLEISVLCRSGFPCSCKIFSCLRFRY